MPAPTAAEVANYLAASGLAWTDEELDAVLAAEQAAQAHACTVPAVDAEWPADLAAALMRRCARALAMKRLPTGIALGEVTATRVSGQDVEVRRYEAPYRRVVVG